MCSALNNDGLQGLVTLLKYLTTKANNYEKNKNQKKNKQEQKKRQFIFRVRCQNQ